MDIKEKEFGKFREREAKRRSNIFDYRKTLGEDNHPIVGNEILYIHEHRKILTKANIWKYEGIIEEIQAYDIYYKKVLIFIGFVLLDYILTYIGINKLFFIEEGNPLMVWLFNIPFISGLSIRFLISIILAILIFIPIKMGYKYSKQFIKLTIFIQVLVFIAHLRWITIYLLFII